MYWKFPIIIIIMLLSHWLFITRSRLMQADWLNLDNNAVANLHTYLPY